MRIQHAGNFVDSEYEGYTVELIDEPHTVQMTLGNVTIQLTAKEAQALSKHLALIRSLRRTSRSY
jgi:protein subunit release factor B